MHTEHPAADVKRRRRRIIQGLLSAAVIVAVFAYALPHVADFSKVGAEMGRMTWFELATLTVLALWNMVTYWFVVVASLPGSNMWQAMKVTQTSTAVANTVPGGGALGVGVSYSMWNSYGFSASEIGLSVLVSGIWNNFVKLGMPIVALLLLALQGDASTSLLTASVAGVVALAVAIGLLGLVLHSERLARSVGRRLQALVSFVRRVFRRPTDARTEDAVVGFRRDAIVLLRRRGVGLTLATLVSHLSLFAVLLLTLRHVGVSDVEVGWAEALAAFSFVRLVSALPVTPGGLGVVELGLTAALVAAGGERAAVVASVLVYRGLTYLLPVPFGLAAYLRFKRGASARKQRLEQQTAAVEATRGT